jgi:hypothetical protein
MFNCNNSCNNINQPIAEAYKPDVNYSVNLCWESNVSLAFDKFLFEFIHSSACAICLVFTCYMNMISKWHIYIEDISYENGIVIWEHKNKYGPLD